MNERIENFNKDMSAKGLILKAVVLIVTFVICWHAAVAVLVSSWQ